MIHNPFEHLFGELHTRSIGGTFHAERHCISSGSNHVFCMIRKVPLLINPHNSTKRLFLLHLARDRPY